MSCQHILNLDNFPFLKMLRPDFDRFGAWFTMGNINLHLINGLKILVFWVEPIMRSVFQVDRVSIQMTTL